jgi:hypothetical protein
VAAVNFGAAGIGDVDKKDFFGSFSIVMLHDTLQVSMAAGAAQSCLQELQALFSCCLHTTWLL